MEKQKEKYNIGDIKPMLLGKLMDDINEYLIKYYSLENKAKPTFFNIEQFITKKYRNVNNVQLELVLNIMLTEGYIIGIHSESKESVSEFQMAEKGLLFFFSGGFLNDYKKKRNERYLMLLGQIGIIIAGIYYLLEILKTFGIHMNCN